MIRRFTAIALAVAVQAYALTAPFMHAHLDDHDADHHAAPEVHSHFSAHATHHAAGATEVGEDDHDRPVYLQLFVAVDPEPAPAAGIVISAYDLPAPAEARAHVPVKVVHGLDPPFFTLLPARAPPAFLS